MKNKIICILLLLISLNLFAQNINLEECIESLYQKHPLQKNFDSNEKILEKEKSKINKNWLPQLKIAGNGAYQSETTEMKVNVPNMNIELPEASQERYEVSLKLQQTVFDGFANSNLKKIKKIENETNKLKTELSLFELEKKVTETYFNIMLLESKIEIIELGLENYEEKLSLINSQIENGLKIETDRLILVSEIRELSYDLLNTINTRNTAVKNLSLLISKKISTESNFIIPNIEISESQNFTGRIEKQIFSKNNENIKASKKLVNSKYLPKVIAFSQFSYGQPGFDMFNDEMHDYYTFGVNLDWKIWDWNKRKDDLSILDLNNKKLQQNEKSFDIQTEIQLSTKLNEIENLKFRINTDQNLVILREDILESVNSQYKNGLITSTEYVANSNALLSAKEQLKLNEILLIKEKLDYKNLKGERYEK